MTSRVEVGDRVVISKTSGYFRDHDDNNPKHMKGTVTSVGENESIGFLPVHVTWDNKGINSYRHEDLTKVSGRPGKPIKNVRAPKQTPPVAKQRKLNIRYASGKDYHLKNVKNVVIDTRTNELKVSYNQDRDGTEFRVNFTVPFADLTAVNFQDKVSKVSAGYFFEDGELVHRVEHFATKPSVFQH